MLETPLESTPPPPPASKWPRLLFIALPVVVIGAGVAFWNFKSSTGGADSPQAAVERLVRAITDEDPLGVLAALDPTEGDVFRQAYEPTADQAASQDLVADGGDPLASVDVKADDLEYDVDKLGERVAAVHVTSGKFSASFDPSKLPAKTRRDHPPDFDHAQSGSTSIAELQKDSDEPLPALVTIKRGSGWYVSVFYTVAEGIRQASGLPQPDFDHPPASRGADSPKDVITQLAAAIGAVDIDRGLQLLDPESLQVLVDYRKTIESRFDEDDLAEERKNFSFSLDELDVKTTALDDVHTRVDVAKVRAHGVSVDDGVPDAATFAVDGTCGTVVDTIGRAKPEETKSCLEDTGYTFGLHSFFVVVAARAGEYYLDPLRTIEEYARIITDSKDFKSLLCEAGGASGGKDCASET
jgi:hypothetical protein